jgi:hypothetical protein
MGAVIVIDHPIILLYVVLDVLSLPRVSVLSEELNNLVDELLYH